MKVLRGGIVQIKYLLAQRALGRGRSAGSLRIFNGHAETLAQSLDRFGKIQLLRLTHERDHVTRLAAAEALVETLVGVDVERRRLLVVEGTQAFESRAAGF